MLPDEVYSIRSKSAPDGDVRPTAMPVSVDMLTP